MDVENIELTDLQISKLRSHRGGCHCHTMRMPPCCNCTNPLTEDEAQILGFMPFCGVCLDAFGAALREGKEYEVHPDDDGLVKVRNEEGKARAYFAYRFRVA